MSPAITFLEGLVKILAFNFNFLASIRFLILVLLREVYFLLIKISVLWPSSFGATSRLMVFCISYIINIIFIYETIKYYNKILKFYKFIVKVKKKYISYLMFSGSKEIKKYYLENFNKKVFFFKNMREQSDFEIINKENQIYI